MQGYVNIITGPTTLDFFVGKQLENGWAFSTIKTGNRLHIQSSEGKV